MVVLDLLSRMVAREYSRFEQEDDVPSVLFYSGQHAFMMAPCLSQEDANRRQ